MKYNSKLHEQLCEQLPVPIELLLHPIFGHRYHDQEGRLLPVAEIRRIEDIWKSNPPPAPIKIKEKQASLRLGTS